MKEKEKIFNVKISRLKNGYDAKCNLTFTEWEKILKSQKKRCNICKKKFNKKLTPTIDHIIPLSWGGNTTTKNIQALCHSCNSKKSNKTNKKKTKEKISEKGCLKLQLLFKPHEFEIYEWLKAKAKADKRGVSPMAIVVLEEAKTRDENDSEFKGVM